jgi:peptidoglycan/LPS O-acetylase OafA/YrhL
MQYRAEIDGLRAVAVLPVILFHAGFGLFSGGFVGVDVFFVISGYLITTIIVTDIARGRFSLLRFYERRVRRILPTLFLVMALCVPFAWMWMIPADYAEFSKSMATVALFASNIHFMDQAGYFARDSEFQPLLHTWSLAIEEQYYLFFPLMVMALWRFGSRKLAYGVLALVVVSFAIGELGSRFKPDKNFFFSLSRFWELGVGSLCALVLLRFRRLDNNWLGALGLALIVASILLYDQRVPFPSVYTLAPVLGTAMIILFAGAGTWTARLLSQPALVGIGLISYSAYLWHQPLFAFARMRSFTEPGVAMMTALAALSLGLAYLSWRFVEQPFRRSSGPFLPDRRVLFGASGAVALVFVAFGFLGNAQGGFPDRMDERLQAISQSRGDTNPKPSCLFERGQAFDAHPYTACLADPVGAPVEAVLLGDSHSHAIAYETQKRLLEEGVNSYAVAMSACVPLEGFRRSGKYDDGQCSLFVESVLDFMRAEGIGKLVLTARFPFYQSGERFDNGEGGFERTTPIHVDLKSRDTAVRAAEDEARRSDVLNAFVSRIKDLAEEFDVVLVYPIPEAGWDVPRQAARLAMFNASFEDLTTPYAAYAIRNREIIPAFDAIASDRLTRVRPAEVLCETSAGGRCSNTRAGEILYIDDDHLSNAGARLVAEQIAEALR